MAHPMILPVNSSCISPCPPCPPWLSFLQLFYEILEHLPSMLVVLELIEAGTRGRQENHISRPRHPRGLAYCDVQSPHAQQRHGIGQMAGDLLRGRTDQQYGARFLLE